ncbi:MAG: AAA family ATPase [Gemmatimonadetes bacterium]|nr:AAA family ATPase [Gemmatimonadota bacterium]
MAISEMPQPSADYRRLLREVTGARAGLLVVKGAFPKDRSMVAEEVAAVRGSRVRAIAAPSVAGKYIGETEKNLARLFEAAAGSGSVLFFDEADDLFGKRTQREKRQDTYAGTCLLELLNRHPVFCILGADLNFQLPAELQHPLLGVVAVERREASVNPPRSTI